MKNTNIITLYIDEPLITAFYTELAKFHIEVDPVTSHSETFNIIKPTLTFLKDNLSYLDSIRRALIALLGGRNLKISIVKSDGSSIFIEGDLDKNEVTELLKETNALIISTSNKEK
ncbi:hypothetical protein [Xenorhabdus budapestensis]|uniref:Uncharacterized protein n=1 Tax=Xenorhabdus budapestensis TaxID=290110 RepID=A0A2D0J461_XENBU|nr:hypothetical protein [Xenorhabdus budapestensis]PHM29222.1 hypothetical protein Xbud_00671 [Xenorhabdus budapestensis]QTL41348.1 hypothetical protein HGO23_08615 [Xenorhabdus budapestensis]